MPDHVIHCYPSTHRHNTHHVQSCNAMKHFFNKDHQVSVGTTPHPVTVTTRIITFLIGDPYKPSFVTVTGRGVDLKYQYLYQILVCPPECQTPGRAPQNMLLQLPFTSLHAFLPLTLSKPRSAKHSKDSTGSQEFKP